MEKQVLRIKVVHGRHTDHVSKEKLVVSLTALLSQIGGMASLFMGLTVTVVGEILDLLYCCIKGALRMDHSET